MKAQGYREADHHLYLPVIMKGEFKLWYDNVSGDIASWNDFKLKFTSRFDNALIQMERSRTLHSRKQGELDPCEQFIYEMVNLAKQVDPTEIAQISLKRARDALHPQISGLIGEVNPWTIENLLERVAEVHANLHHQSRRMHRKTADIPPLQGLREDLKKKRDQENYKKRGKNIKEKH